MRHPLDKRYLSQRQRRGRSQAPQVRQRTVFSEMKFIVRVRKNALLQEWHVLDVHDDVRGIYHCVNSELASRQSKNKPQQSKTQRSTSITIFSIETQTTHGPIASSDETNTNDSFSK